VAASPGLQQPHRAEPGLGCLVPPLQIPLVQMAEPPRAQIALTLAAALAAVGGVTELRVLLATLSLAGRAVGAAVAILRLEALLMEQQAAELI
jgi:hypothetical protein